MMVDVSGKKPTLRTAVAAGTVIVNRETFDRIESGRIKKGDVLAVAQVAGIMAAKKKRRADTDVPPPHADRRRHLV